MSQWRDHAEKTVHGGSREGVKTMLDDLAPRNPKAAAADPKAFVDLSFVKELEASGFIKQLYKR